MKIYLLILLTFILTVLLEILAVLDYYAIIHGAPALSALYTGFASLTGAIIVRVYVDNKWMIVPDVIGSAIGAYIAVKYCY